jgi:hypothetical protein
MVQSKERLIRRKKNSRIAVVLMIFVILAFGIVYIQVVETIKDIKRDNATSESKTERVEVGSGSDSVNLYESR